MKPEDYQQARCKDCGVALGTTHASGCPYPQRYLEQMRPMSEKEIAAAMGNSIQNAYSAELKG
jgi:hypothetical protein